eukprot:193188-Alexandrium_andersonii.AAC.1
MHPRAAITSAQHAPDDGAQLRLTRRIEVHWLRRRAKPLGLLSGLLVAPLRRVRIAVGLLPLAL